MILGEPLNPMKTNVGSYDAAIRFVVGCILLGYGAHHLNPWGLLGFIPIMTAATGCCPLYYPFHIDTTFTDRPHDHT